MRDLNVIDLDGTLVPFDTFRTLVLSNKTLSVLSVIAFRKLGLLSRPRTAMLLTRRLSHVLSDDAKMKRFTDQIVTASRAEVMDKVAARSAANTLNLLLSASPHAYVKRVAEALGYEGIGSHWDNGRYIHCYGSHKLELLETCYPRSQYHYRYMIADSESDLVVMRAFEEYERV